MALHKPSSRELNCTWLKCMSGSFPDKIVLVCAPILACFIWCVFLHWHMFYLVCLSSPTFSARVQCWLLHSKLVTNSICQVIWIKHNVHIFWPADGLVSSLEDTTIWCDLSNPQLLEILKMLQTLDWEIQNVSDCTQLWHIWYDIVQYPRGHKLSKDSTLGKADGSIELTRI